MQQQSCEKAHIRQQQQALLVRRESHSTAAVQDEKSDLVGVSYKEKTITIFKAMTQRELKVHGQEVW